LLPGLTEQRPWLQAAEIRRRGCLVVWLSGCGELVRSALASLDWRILRRVAPSQMLHQHAEQGQRTGEQAFVHVRCTPLHVRSGKFMHNRTQLMIMMIMLMIMIMIIQSDSYSEFMLPISSPCMRPRRLPRFPLSNLHRLAASPECRHLSCRFSSACAPPPHICF
jgi:hypothetical protein